MEKYQKVRVLGKGSFGSAILIKRKTDNSLFVVKEVSLLKMSKKEREEARHECTVLQQLHHPNIVRYIEQFENRNNLYIVMEYCDGGDLAGKVKDARGPMKESTVMYYFSQVCLAIEYLHSRHILHRDIKTMNVFLMKNGAVKLGDFGISTILRNTMGMANTVCGTPYYFSPELCRNKPYNNKSDIWALGVLLYECCTGGRHPFDGNSMNQLMQRIVKGSYPPLSGQYSSEFRKMVDWCLQKDPHKRPSIKQTLALPLVRRSLEQLEENLMLATQCRVRLKDIIDFEAGMDNPVSAESRAESPTSAAASPSKPSPTPGLTPGQAAALAMAKEQQRQAEQQRPAASPTASPGRAVTPPRSPRGGGAAAVVGPKPSAAANAARNGSPSKQQAAHFSPYHQEIMKNLERLREQKNHAAGAAGKSPAESPPTSPAAAARGTPAARPSSPQQNRMDADQRGTPSPRPSVPAAAGAAPSRKDLYALGRPRSKGEQNAPSKPSPTQSPVPEADGMQRVDAIIARYGQNVDAQAMETIHAYMRRKQEEYMKRQKEENDRQERRNDLRQRELKRVLDRQRGLGNGNPVYKSKADGEPPAPVQRRSNASPMSAGGGAADAGVPPPSSAGRPSARPGLRPSPPQGPTGNSPRPGKPKEPAAAAPPRSRTPTQAANGRAAQPPAHLRAKPGAFGRDPGAAPQRRSDASAAASPAGDRRKSAQLSSQAAGRNPLVRAGGESPRSMQRPSRKIAVAANSPGALSNVANGKASPVAAAGRGSSPESRSSAGGAASPSSRGSKAPSRNSDQASGEELSRNELVAARRAAAQELQERREKLLARQYDDVDVGVRGIHASDDIQVRRPHGALSPQRGPPSGHTGAALSDNASAESPYGKHGGVLAMAESPTRRSADVRASRERASPFGLEAVGHHAVPNAAVSPSRRRPTGGLSPVAPLSPSVNLLTPTPRSPTGGHSDAHAPASEDIALQSPRSKAEGALHVVGHKRGSQAKALQPLAPVAADGAVDRSHHTPTGPTAAVVRPTSSPRANLRSPASKRPKANAGSSKHRAGALPPVSGEVPELIDIQYGVAHHAGHAGRDADSDGPASGLRAPSDPLRMLRKKMSLVDGGGAASPARSAPSASSVDVPAVHHMDLESPSRAHHLQQPVHAGGTSLYAGMQRGPDTSAEEADSFLVQQKRGSAAEREKNERAVMPNVLETLRSARPDSRGHESELSSDVSSQLALLKNRQGQQQQQARPQDGARVALPPKTTGTPGGAGASGVPSLQQRRPQGRIAPVPPLQPIASVPPSDSAAASPSSSSATDGYAEMLQHLKDLLERRRESNAKAKAGREAAHARKTSTPSVSLGSYPDELAGRSPPALHCTKVQPRQTEAAPAGKNDSKTVVSLSSESGNGSDGAPRDTEDDNDEDEDFEDAVPLSPVRHTELNDTYTRMMAKIGQNSPTGARRADEYDDEETEDGVYTNDVFLNNAKAGEEEEEDGEEGYTGYYKLPSPTSLLKS